ncbi:MAG: arginine--tRNA ligase [bacterium]|nr:arginine--tRNA ligase [bacterium]
MEIREKLLALIAAVLHRCGAGENTFSLEHPADVSRGDYATNAALIAAGQLGKSPREIATQLAVALEDRKPVEIERIEVAGHGFINFFLSQQFFASSVTRVLEAGERFGRNETLVGKKVMVEYTDPNPFKVFHIGHLMTNVIGESIARVFEFSGAEVKRANYQGDVGLHVAKAIWGMQSKAGECPEESAPLSERTAYLGVAYVLGAAAYEEDADAKHEIQHLNRKIYDRSDTEINRLYDAGRQWSLDHFEELYAKLGTKFDYYFFESEVAGPGKQLVEEYKARGVFEESDGATIFRGEREGLHTRVFLTRDGLPTYEAKELALAEMKYEKYPYGQSVIVTANEITEYFRVLLAAMAKIFPDLASRTHHITHGMLRLATGKMSSRTGTVITGESLIEDSIALAREKMRVSDVLAGEEREAVAEAVGVGALKYAILRQNRSRDIIYDAEKSFSLEGDSGPYLQYAYVRACSVMEKARQASIEYNNPLSTFHFPPSPLDRLLYQFPEVVSHALEEYEPHHVTTYLTELAASFNSFYASHTIIDPDNPELSSYRLSLTAAVAQVLKNGLSLLGIRAPEWM